MYSTLPILALIQELPTKMPAYMGFFLSKAISMAWGLAKTYKVAPTKMPFEQAVGMALLCGLIGFVSVKQGKVAAMKKELRASIL